MKKVGIIVFAATLVVGVAVAGLFSFGRVSGRILNISIDRPVTGSGVPASEERNVAEFSGIDASGMFHVDITSGKEQSVRIEADDNILPRIQTEVRGGVLHLESEGRINMSTPVRVTITMNDLESIDASGASRISAVNVKNGSLRINSSGASKISVAGETTRLTVDVSGASNVDTAGLQAQDASVDASGASRVEVLAVNRLESDASGASRVVYSGSPANLIKRSSGASSITQK